MASKKDQSSVGGRNASSSRSTDSRSVTASKSNTTTAHYNQTEGKKMSRKDKKIEKKLAKFNERDLRSYPMTVGKWIGTFILLALPLINVICCILWFFGVGNKSRSAWIRAHVLRIVIIIVLIVAIIGGGFMMLKNAASKNAGAETTPEIIFYGVGQVADLIGGIAGQETAEMIKAMFAEMLGIEYEPQFDEDGDSSQNDDEYVYEGDFSQGWEEGEENGDEEWGYGY